VIPDTDIHKIAIRMVRKHGAAAPTYVEMEAEKLLGAGDTHNYETWKRILMAIEELLATRPLEAASRT
jgi:hypothetical protein